MVFEFFCVGAVPADPKELAIWEIVLQSLRVVARKVKQGVSVRGFSEKFRFQFFSGSIDVKIEKVDGLVVPLDGELNVVIACVDPLVEG